jgi:NADH dehydrogenase [ubiquinone] 1 alpha subcomplex assembly factor 7
MTVKEYMTAALTHPVHGYYMHSSEVFGRSGDFVTSPEVSQVFGELLGVWCVASWESLGRPERVRLVEMGPGRGTLMADVLRSTAAFTPFHAALQVDLVEVSAHLRHVQRQTLASAGGDVSDVDDAPAATAGATAPPTPLRWRSAAGGDAHVDVHWHASLEEVPCEDGVVELYLAHEFLDALPVHQLVRTPRGWRERQVDLSEHARAAAADGADGADSASSGASSGESSGLSAEWRDLDEDERALDFVVSAAPTPASLLFGERLGRRLHADGSGTDGAPTHSSGDGDDKAAAANVLDCLEVCPGALSFVQQLCRRLRSQRGAALFVDYGGDAVPHDTLRGIAGHRAVHPLHAPGGVDLSVDVDFGALRDVARDESAGALRCPPLVCQRDFLAAMGLEARVNALLRATADREARRALIQSAGRLVASPGMGTAYKVFALAHADVGRDGVPGMAHAPLLEHHAPPAHKPAADDDAPAR